MEIKNNFRKLAILGLAAGAVSLSSMAIAEDLRIVSWGGAYQKAQSKGIFQPAATCDGYHGK